MFYVQCHISIVIMLFETFVASFFVKADNLGTLFHLCLGDDWICIGIFTACIVFPVTILLDGSLTKIECSRIRHYVGRGFPYSLLSIKEIAEDDVWSGIKIVFLHPTFLNYRLWIPFR